MDSLDFEMNNLKISQPPMLLEVYAKMSITSDIEEFKSITKKNKII